VTQTATPSTPPLVRCAIYTRKSTLEGLDEAFTSLDAQREAAEAYIHSQQHAGWRCLPEHYDDGGFTGSNLERPALQRLLADTRPARSTAWCSTKWIASAARCSTLPSSWMERLGSVVKRGRLAAYNTQPSEVANDAGKNNESLAEQLADN